LILIYTYLVYLVYLVILRILRNLSKAVVTSSIKLVKDEEKANCFAENYKGVFSNEENPNFDSCFKKEIEEYVINKKYERGYADKTVKIFTQMELNKVIKEISNKKSLDHEKICNLMIKNFSWKFKMTLLKLFNHCLLNNTIPDEWQQCQ